jgi:hypothetical protein
LDSFVVVPVDLNEWSIISVEASYGQTESADDADFAIQIRDTSYAVVSSINYTHPQSQRNYSFSPPEPFIEVVQGQTINVNIQNDGQQPESSAQGYTVTLTLQLL